MPLATVSTKASAVARRIPTEGSWMPWKKNFRVSGLMMRLMSTHPTSNVSRHGEQQGACGQTRTDKVTDNLHGLLGHLDCRLAREPLSFFVDSSERSAKDTEGVRSDPTRVIIPDRISEHPVPRQSSRRFDISKRRIGYFGRDFMQKAKIEVDDFYVELIWSRTKKSRELGKDLRPGCRVCLKEEEEECADKFIFDVCREI
jgi:hypothetical protein